MDVSTKMIPKVSVSVVVLEFSRGLWPPARHLALVLGPPRVPWESLDDWDTNIANSYG